MAKDTVYHDENTLVKVREALVRSGLSYDQAQDAIIWMQNFGILFREVVPG